MTLGQTTVFIITSTFGDGDAPDHAIVFKDVMRQAILEHKVSLDGIPYSVLALGSTAYEQFCAFGIECDLALEALGGSRMVPLVKADARYGQEKAFEDWAKSSYRNLCHNFNMELDNQVQNSWPFSKPKAKLAFGKRLKLKPEMKGNFILTLKAISTFDSDLLQICYYSIQLLSVTRLWSIPFLFIKKGFLIGIG